MSDARSQRFNKYRSERFSQLVSKHLMNREILQDTHDMEFWTVSALDITIECVQFGHIFCFKVITLRLSNQSKTMRN